MLFIFYIGKEACASLICKRILFPQGNDPQRLLILKVTRVATIGTLRYSSAYLYVSLVHYVWASLLFSLLLKVHCCYNGHCNCSINWCSRCTECPPIILCFFQLCLELCSMRVWYQGYSVLNRPCPCGLPTRKIKPFQSLQFLIIIDFCLRHLARRNYWIRYFVTLCNR